MTLIEVLVVICVLAFLAIYFLPHINHPSNRAPRISCVNNLKQVGLAYRIWEGDNGDKYPMQTSVTNGGTMELADGKNA
jgi:type II secretory pathway pseudopilin PulG